MLSCHDFFVLSVFKKKKRKEYSLNAVEYLRHFLCHTNMLIFIMCSICFCARERLKKL